jgi:hypothetical protein
MLLYQQPRPVGFSRDKLLNVRSRSATCVVTTLKGFMATTNYIDTSIAITQLFAQFGYAKIIQQTARFSRRFHSLAANHVEITKFMEPTIMLLLISDVYISTLARTNGGSAQGPAKVELA